jgi:hypothetical protein
MDDAFLVTWGLVAITCGALGAWLRAKKGEMLTGLLAGVLLGPIGVFVAALWPVRQEKATPEQKVCPDCAERVLRAARRCRFCSHEFEPA